MKKIIVSLVALLTLMSCGSEDGDKYQISDISGEWVTDGYRNEVIKSQSPKAATGVLNGYTGICISDVKDSAFVLIIINNHEGITGLISPSKRGRDSKSFKFINDEGSPIDMEISLEDMDNGNKVVRVIEYGENDVVTSTSSFERVADFKDINDPCGLTAIQVLLEDKWCVIDSDEKKIADIKIDEYGNIEGWEMFTIIRVNTDFVIGGEDQVRLSTENTREALPLRADFQGDRILLYDSDSLTYSLIRDNVGN